MPVTAEERALIFLHACSRLDYREAVAALRAARDPAALPALGEEKNLHAADVFIAELEKRGYFAVTLVSDDYPESLKAIPDPPLVLYGAGRRELLQRRRFCIVGSRIIPAWAEKLGKRIAGEVAERFAVVTGLAEGGDSAAIAGALTGGLICVLPCGLNSCYPAAHASLKDKIARQGLLLTEYLPDVKATKYAFYARNRILAGLSEGVLVLSAGERSGALITASDAAEYGRDVFALPHNAEAGCGAGCNELIKKGAFLTTCAEDILSVYGMETARREAPELTEDEARVLAVLKERGEAHVAEICDRTGLRVYEAAAVCSSLEIKGVAVKAGGNRYAAV